MTMPVANQKDVIYAYFRKLNCQLPSYQYVRIAWFEHLNRDDLHIFLRCKTPKLSNV